VGPRASLDRCGKSRPPPGFDPYTAQPVASRHTDGATRPTYKHISKIKLKVARCWVYVQIDKKNWGKELKDTMNQQRHAVSSLILCITFARVFFWKWDVWIHVAIYVTERRLNSSSPAQIVSRL
jgi:hypothetical protein